MPYEDPDLPRYPEDDGIRSNAYGVEVPNIHFASSSKETAFWDRFFKTHPHPPEDLEREQFMVAESILGSRLRYHQEGNPAGTNSDRLTRGEVAKRQRAQRLGTPLETLTDDALFWSYTLKKRREYEKTIASLVGVNDYIVTNWVAHLFVDPQYVTQPLTSEQVKAADAWKFAYLKRLRSERTNESYVDAYLKAWNLSAAEVFSGTNGR